MTGIIPNNQPVWLDAIGRRAKEACVAWEYFLIPEVNNE
jgi:hypothetical protein